MKRIPVPHAIANCGCVIPCALRVFWIIVPSSFAVINPSLIYRAVFYQSFASAFKGIFTDRDILRLSGCGHKGNLPNGTIVGSVPKFWGNGERGMGNGEAGKKRFSSTQNFPRPRLSPPPRAAETPGKRGYISLRLIFLSTFLLKSRGPPKKRISDCVIGIPCARRSSIRRKVQTKSAI